MAEKKLKYTVVDGESILKQAEKEHQQRMKLTKQLIDQQDEPVSCVVFKSKDYCFSELFGNYADYLQYLQIKAMNRIASSLERIEKRIENS